MMKKMMTGMRTKMSIKSINNIDNAAEFTREMAKLYDEMSVADDSIEPEERLVDCE